ncbi:MAG: DegT/DnrJ/EryC1/StrS family aminotransferase [Planctomycetaceae bacterium]|jgi:dTDP-4-amino-4,6-dideoxygalactose transaminase|nr:DegT/DnrJ/EryC1/StrS family aminotransferase [Planctomycetaceae bacterium]
MTATRNVPFFNYPQVYLDDKEKLLEILDNVGSRGAFIGQSDLLEFEENLAQYTGIKHVIGVGNATDALWMLCRAAGLTSGDEVIFCSHTMVATAAGIHFTGATPVPCEVGFGWTMDPQSVEKCITKKTKAIMPTQLNGRCADMDALKDICNKNGLMLLEDSAQALGAKYKEITAGGFGRGGVISFYPAKTLGCLGDGGCVITNDDEIAKLVRQYSNHGRNEKLETEYWCLNSRLDNLQAAFLNYKLSKYKQSVERRRNIARIYHAGLNKIEQLVLQPSPDNDPNYFDIFQNFEIEAEKRDELKAYLVDNGIGTLIQWGGTPVHLMQKLGFTQSLPKTERFFTRCIMLPMNTSVSDEDINYVCDKIVEFYRNK